MKIKAFIPVIALVACTSENPKTADDSVIAGSRGVVVAPGESASTAPSPAPAPPEEAPAAEWEVTPAGIGSIKAGMSLEEVNIVTHNGIDMSKKLEECDYARLKNAPEGVAMMVEKGTVSRIEVREGSVATTKGAKIGDSEDRIKSLYPGQVKVMPHKYTDGHYLVVTPPSGGNNRIVFETDGQKVLRYRSGREPAVEYVESCS